MLRRIGYSVLAVVCVLFGLWIAALTLLPDAPSGGSWRRVFGHPSVPPPTSSVSWDGSVLAMPIAGVARDTVQDSWGDPRDNGKRLHHGTDIVAPAMTPVLAAAPGTVEKLWASAAGGTTLYIRSPARDRTYYYAHLGGYAPGMHEGQVIKAGDPIGFVGDTGNAGTGNYHLHFGLTRTSPDQRWYQGVDIDPYPYLAGKAASR